MRAISLVFVAALAAPAAADAVQKEPEVVLNVDPPPKRETRKGQPDLVSAIRNVRSHLAAWIEDPFAVSNAMLFGHDTITIVKLTFK